MAIIYTYPEISDLQLNDLALVTDKSDNNNTKQASISQILSLIPPGVDSLNGFTGNIDIIAGNNITIDNVTGQNKIEIASTSNTISSGNNGEFAFFAGTGSTLSGSPLLTATSNRVFIQDYISHKDNSTGNTAFFGFNDDNEFLVYLDSGAQERLQLKDDFFSVYTGTTPKISAGATYASLAHELVSAAPTKSASTLITTERGVKVSTTYRSDSAGSDLGFGGQIQFAASQDAGEYVGLMGPISSELTANYNLMLPNEPGTSGQLLAVGATSHGTSPNQYRKLEWIDGGSAVGVTKITAGSGITLNPSSGLGEVEITSTSDGSRLVETVKNETGSVIQKGQPLHITGVSGIIPTVDVALSSNASLMPVSGLANEEIGIGSTGEMIISGILDGINTADIEGSPAEASILYVGGNFLGSIPGITTDTPTGETGLIQNVGIIIKNSPGSSGSIQVTAIGRTNATPNLNKGSIFVGNSTNSSSVLSVGTNDYVLTANSAAAQGVEWKQTVSQDTNVANSNLVFDNSWVTNIGNENIWTILATEPLGPEAPGELIISVAGGVDFGDSKPTAAPTSVSMEKGTLNLKQDNWEVSATGTTPDGDIGWPAPPTKVDLDVRKANNNFFDLYQSVDINITNAVVGATYKFIAFYQEPGYKLNLFYEGGLVKFPNSTDGNVGQGSQISTPATGNIYEVYDLYCVQEPDPGAGILGIMLATQSLNH